MDALRSMLCWCGFVNVQMFLSKKVLTKKLGYIGMGNKEFQPYTRLKYILTHMRHFHTRPTEQSLASFSLTFKECAWSFFNGLALSFFFEEDATHF